MRVLRIIASMDPKMGGPCEGVRNSIPAMKAFGVQNEVVCFDSPNASFLAGDGVNIQPLGPSKGPYAYCPRLAIWLRQNLLRFDVVIIHGLWLYNSYGTYRIWEKLKKKNSTVPKLYLMPHGMLDPYFQKDKSRRLKSVRNWLFWKLVERRVVNGIDGVLFTCEQELLLARKTFAPYHPKGEFDVGYGIQSPPLESQKPIEEFYKKCPEVKLQPYWLFLGRIHPKKGVDLLLKAYLKLKEQDLIVPALVIAGPNLESSFGKTLLKMSSGKPIYFPGMLEGSAKWAAFRNCEAFILPSHQENFGIAVVEAMACGKPVLVSDQVNIWREIQTSKAGFICEDSEEGIFEMLKYWLKQSEEEKKKMGARALKVFQQNYDIKKAAARMIECVQ